MLLILFNSAWLMQVHSLTHSLTFLGLPHARSSWNLMMFTLLESDMARYSSATGFSHALVKLSSCGGAMATSRKSWKVQQLFEVYNLQLQWHRMQSPVSRNIPARHDSPRHAVARVDALMHLAMA